MNIEKNSEKFKNVHFQRFEVIVAPFVCKISNFQIKICRMIWIYLLMEGRLCSKTCYLEIHLFDLYLQTLGQETQHISWTPDLLFVLIPLLLVYLSNSLYRYRKGNEVPRLNYLESLEINSLKYSGIHLNDPLDLYSSRLLQLVSLLWAHKNQFYNLYVYE